MKPLIIHQLLVFGRNGSGAPVTVVQEPVPLTDAQRAGLARRFGTLTGFVSQDIPEQLPAIQFDPDTGIPDGAVPAAFFDGNGRPTDGEAACIAIFRALANQKQTLARRVLLQTSAGYVSVQEEVFRRPPLAQVWMEQPLSTAAAHDVTATLQSSLPDLPVTGSWLATAHAAPPAVEQAQSVALSSGPNLLLAAAADLAALKALSLPSTWPAALQDAAINHLLLFTTNTGNPFVDVYVRHLAKSSGSDSSATAGLEERPASLWANAALGCHLFRQGHEKTYWVVEQGPPASPLCRLSVWLEVDGGYPSRVSVGGPVVGVGTQELPLEALLGGGQLPAP